MGFVEKITKDLTLPIAYCKNSGEILYVNNAWRNLIITRKHSNSRHKNSVSSELLPYLQKVTNEKKNTANYKINIEKR